MADPFIGEIRIFPFTFAPADWLLCNGQQVPIQQYAALYAVLGLTYGGNGTTTFQLPDLQARAPLGAGTGVGLAPRPLGTPGGAATVTLALNQLAAHTHLVNVVALDGGTTAVTTPANNTVFGSSQAKSKTTGYVTATGPMDDALNALAILPSGDSQPHNNLPPFMTFNFCIATDGFYPQRP